MDYSSEDKSSNQDTDITKVYNSTDSEIRPYENLNVRLMKHIAADLAKENVIVEDCKIKMSKIINSLLIRKAKVRYLKTCLRNRTIPDDLETAVKSLHQNFPLPRLEYDSEFREKYNDLVKRAQLRCVLLIIKQNKDQIEALKKDFHDYKEKLRDFIKDSDRVARDIVRNEKILFKTTHHEHAEIAEIVIEDDEENFRKKRMPKGKKKDNGVKLKNAQVMPAQIPAGCSLNGCFFRQYQNQYY